MSNTNLTGTELNCSTVKPEENKLKGRKPGSATKAEKLGKRDIEQGVESLTIVIMPYMINGEGERFGGQGNKISKATKTPTEIQEKHARMEKFNQVKLEKTKRKTKKKSGDQIEDR